jgi:hypothetical protein
LLAGAEFDLRVNDFGPLVALGFRVVGQRALHRLGQLEVENLDAGYFHSPRARLNIDDLLELGIDLVSLGQQVIEADWLRMLRNVVWPIYEVARK